MKGPEGSPNHSKTESGEIIKRAPHEEPVPGNLPLDRRVDLNEALRSVEPNVEIVDPESYSGPQAIRKPLQAIVEKEERERTPRTPFQSEEDKRKLKEVLDAFDNEVRTLRKEK